MSGKILVAYATRNGSTAGIAEAIGKELQSAGYNVDVTEIRSVTTLEGYHAVVMGAPLYMGKVIDIGKFVSHYREQLSGLPIAAFAVGLAPVSKDPGKVEASVKALNASLAPLSPVVSGLFAGMLNPEKLSFIQRKMTEMVKSPVGDFRDWALIAAWSRELPGKMGIESGHAEIMPPRE